MRDAADLMVEYEIGRLPVVERQQPARVVGIITRNDILSAYRHRLEESRRGDPVIDFPLFAELRILIRPISRVTQRYARNTQRTAKF